VKLLPMIKQNFNNCGKTKRVNNSNKEQSEYRALRNISRSALCCRSNKTRASVANPPNSAQLGGTVYHSPKLHPVPCSSVGMRRGTDRHTDGCDLQLKPYVKRLVIKNVISDAGLLGVSVN